MYTLCNTAQHRFPGADVYVLDVRRTAAGLVAITSDQRLTQLDATRLGDGAAATASWATEHGTVTTLGVLDGALVCTAGEDGCVGVWDLRLGARVAHFRAGGAPILSVACSPATHTLAVGTELRDHTASMLLWDVRGATPTPRARYDDAHSDDVTALAFSPVAPDLLLSGSADGLVSLHDTRVADDDDVTLRTLNHGASLHRAGFLARSDVFALSNDEQFTLYPVVDDDEHERDALVLGDLRPRLGCQYVADVVPKTDGSGAVVGAGSHDRHTFDLVFLARDAAATQPWVLDAHNSVRLHGAHGTDLVRAFCFFDEGQLVFTAGEDGCIKAWGAGG